MTKITVIGNEGSGKTTLASKLGKKGAVSDIVTYEFSKSGEVLTIIDPAGYPKSIKPLLTALHLSDIALVCIPPEGPDIYAGECILSLDLLNYRHGIFVLTKSDTTYSYAQDELKDKIKKIVAGTTLEEWDYIEVSATEHEGMNELRDMIFTIGKKVDSEHRELDSQSPRVVIDQVFNVTGIGCVALGVVKQGSINIKDKLSVFPTSKEIEIRSIQIHDEDKKQAFTGDRVGLALKNIQSKEIERGYIISEKELVDTGFNLKCRISRFSKKINLFDVLHLFSGIQSSPVRVERIEINDTEVDSADPGSECTLHLAGEKEIAYSTQDRFIIVNLDEKQRFSGYGFP
ncbi:elongation factor Tu domain 2 protein [Methanosalsum zhilinae DSM 4017]|uniref:Elongation factor Tu domain 2 protein n=1 Tax=Methanosalsum zhilinae (strain DSM 4017 / NBRC 107636 / OCM 62 / WeN5) TaxID=679901 RepID=F7XMH4_METZD|nr:EF-Tu/IF-2/RF-3 family GTPase [Methanosalsum zhilinae]AEH59897.1 elongation factor Tu domain 2 protein [Methanosalsum zhilinae DSM 4017]